MLPDYYSILQVAPHAEPDIINAAFRRLAWLYHPDTNKRPDAAEKMKAINEAYNVLKDPARRAEYDNQRASDKPAEPAAPSEPPTAPFACERCGRVDSTLRAVVFLYVLSLLVVSMRRGGGQGVLCSRCRQRRGLWYSLLTFLLGPWGLPWGPLWTIYALSTNARGGQQPPEVNGPLLRVLGGYFAAARQPEEALAALRDSLEFEPLGEARAQIRELEREQTRAGKSPLGGAGEGEPEGAQVETSRSSLFAGGAVAIYIVACLAIAAFSSAVALRAYGTGITPVAAATTVSDAQSPVPPPTLALTLTPTLQLAPSVTPVLAPVTPRPVEGSAPVVVIPYLTPMPERRMYVCVSLANVRSGPGTDFSTVRQLTGDYYVTVFGATGEWYYIGFNADGVDQFINQQVVCEQPVTPERPRRAATAVPPAPSLCANYALPKTPNISRDRGGRPPIRGIIRGNGVRVYYDIADNEYWDPNERGDTLFFNCPKEAEAQGFAAGHPK